MIIAFAGPITNLIIILIYLLFDVSTFGLSREMIIYSNMIIGLFNLLPLYPLDGGRIIKNILHITFGLKKAIIYTNKVSNAVMIILTAISSIAILYFQNIAILLIVIYLWYLIIKQNKRYATKMRIYKAIEST